MQRGIREEHPYFRRPKDSPDVYLNLRPITTLVAALAVGEVEASGMGHPGSPCKGGLQDDP